MDVGHQTEAWKGQWEQKQKQKNRKGGVKQNKIAIFPHFNTVSKVAEGWNK